MKTKKLSIISVCLCLFICICVILTFIIYASDNSQESSDTFTARPSVNGRLHVHGNMLSDSSGSCVQLRGVSTHGLTWFPDIINESLFSYVSEDWDCSLIRLAMYSSIYCGGQKDESLTLMKKGIEAAINADMYVIVDWHILEDSNPNLHKDEAAEFFELIASQYAEYPNLIFEICNEPNNACNWSDIMEYSQQIIPVIRQYIPDALILVGTPEYDNNLSAAILRPLEYDNIMYVLHFYAATHKQGLMDELALAVDSGLPVFISECGICESSGDGIIDYDSAADWFTYLNENNISYAVWSLSEKMESSAFLVPGFDEKQPLRDTDLTPTGIWIRELIRGKDPAAITSSVSQSAGGGPGTVLSLISNSLRDRYYDAVKNWIWIAAAAVLLIVLFIIINIVFFRHKARKTRTYDSVIQDSSSNSHKGMRLGQTVLLFSILFTIIYLGWRIIYSVPVRSGILAVAGNIILLIVEVFGFAESLILFYHSFHLKEHPLPVIPEDLYPEVDVFIATYNEPEELLRRTINGCLHMKYPDLSKVHIWICDDNRRPSMRALAEEMKVGYFDRPDNKGAKAGNLNHALSLTHAPYIVTFDADMIPRNEFLLKTIPYFVDLEIRNKNLDPEDQTHLGFLQTPQSFYQPDIFQNGLYSEKRVPNEQDFFYRTIEPGKTYSNSVIYGGSNTVLSRRALNDIGGFYTESITEDFATGALIEAKGYVSLALPEPLASGQTPQTFKEHIKQRTRWGRGVIVTARKIRIWKQPGLSLEQKLSYFSSVFYWYSPVKNLIYMISPLIFAVFAIPVFTCNWLELLVFWLPMFLMQDINLRINSRGKISIKWSGIYETCVMPHLLIPIIKESLGITLSTFKVTDKSRNNQSHRGSFRDMLPFLIFAAFSAAGIIRIICIFDIFQIISFIVLLFWILRNLYYVIMSIFLVDGRDGEVETVRVQDGEFVTASYEKDGETISLGGITTLLTEHSMEVFWDEDKVVELGTRIHITVENENHRAELYGAVTGIRESRRKQARTQTIEILDYCGTIYEYWEILYDRVPTLPQTLHKDFGVLEHLWQNIAVRVSRTIK